MKPIKRIGSNMLRELQLEEAKALQKASNRELQRFIASRTDQTPEKIKLERENPGKKLIGFWANKEGDSSQLPYPIKNTFEDNRLLEMTANYLDNGEKINHYLGFSCCRICGERLGTSDCSDGTYVWPEKLSHYLIKHKVSLPLNFVNHIIEKQKGE